MIPPEILEIYRAYERELTLGKRPAVLAIDLYNCVFPPQSMPVIDAIILNPSSCGEYAWNAISPTSKLLDFSRKRDFPIFYTTSDPRQQTGIKATKRPLSQNLENDFAFYPDFEPQKNDIIIYKQRASAFFGTPLIANLTQLGIDSIIVCGETTSGCVRASVVDGYSYGFHMVVVEETVFDRSIVSHKVNLFDLHHKYADVMRLDEILAY
ncbi:MAG: hypothetical protein JL57_22305 [Desulfosporosinus sp. BICA1-9]|nr:MAG: hypothetical protein JL57_22305 [Desulfosporosinus sp. BICA1-9]